ncbi:Fic family protein [Fluviibacter phosphoraccumulans]|uniref:Fic family protein n=1 Tax=Fluviibacter phosphoraccumulans TaxID=1751046 RepID=UPI0024E22318|nr:Fic family protein [Fluviibacter phosphoraccumulans]
MKIPLSPPDISTILNKLEASELAAAMKQITPLPCGKYLHWDELRHRTPPDTLSHEAWWASVFFARSGQMHELPLLDKSGKPFKFSMPTPVQIGLHHIDRDAAGHTRSTSDHVAPDDSKRYLMSSLIEEAITSSQLEGAATTRQVAADMLRQGRKPRNHSETMIFNNYRAMEMLRSMKGSPLTPSFVLELHRTLTEGTLDNPLDCGRLRTDDDINVVDNRDQQVLHIPPAHQELPSRLERLCAFANADETSEPFVHPVVRAILLHFMIGYDHPFVDGNGRTARALYYWSIARSGYWLMEYTSISHILKEAPSQYVRAYLHTETDNNDTTYFVLHQIETIRKAINALHDYLSRKSKEQHETQKLLTASPKLRTRFNHRQQAIITHALRGSGESYRVDAHQRTHNVSYQTARNDLLDLKDLGLLEVHKKGNAYIFFAPADLRERLANLSGGHTTTSQILLGGG